jgi:DNA-binding XRE family transcriptional regulator
MGDTLWMDTKVRGWLAGLRTSDPPLARITAEAVLALLDEGPWLGPPLLVPAAAPRRGAPAVLVDLDEAYQRLLEALTSIRREVASVAIARKRAELDLGAPDGTGSGHPEGLHARLAELTAAEDKLTAYSQRMQARVEEWRMRKETLKAKYAAAQASRTITEAYRMLGDGVGAPEVPFPAADDAVSAVTAEAAELLRTSAELDRELRRIRPSRGPRLRPRKARLLFRPGPGEPDEPVLLSLRPAAPGCLDVRILCAFGPPGRTGAGRGDGHGARDEQRLADGSGPGGQQPDEPVLLLAASARHALPPVEPDPLLQRAEARYWAMLAAEPPPVPGQDARPGGPAAYDRAGFAREFLPGPGTASADAAPGAIAAAVAARARPHRLAELRARSGLTQAEVAGRLGVRQERVSAMERSDVTTMETRTAAAYVEALGGRLEITVDFGTDRVILG